jgi:glutaredoxin-like YruB-family protein
MSEDKKVIVFSTNWCAYCKQVKAYLASKDVAYVEQNIESDEAANREYLQYAGGQFRGVPLTVIGDEVLLGFDRHSIDEALARR